MDSKKLPFFNRLAASIQSHLMNLRMAEHTFMVLLAIGIGLLGGFGAVGFKTLIKLFEGAFWGNMHLTIDYIVAMPWWKKILIPAAGGLIVGPVVYFLAREAKGHGVPEVMEAVAVRGGKIRPRVVLVKAIASALTIGTGGSVGREGPIVQIGSALGSTLGQFLNVSPRKLRTLVGCGAAAGIAATFNAPIAGALFAVEIVLMDFGVSQFSPIVISSVVATVVSRMFIGDFPSYEVPQYTMASPYELIPYAVLGVLAAFVAIAFIKLLYATESFFENLAVPEYTQTLIGGVIIGIIGLVFPQIFGVGHETINWALHGSMEWKLLFILIAIKLVATSITLGSGGSGGILAPSLFLGAMAGGFIGNIVHLLFPEWTAGAGPFALVGMGAVVAGATLGPISGIILIFELTNDYKIIPPLMVSCVIAVLVVSRIQKESIYTLKLVRRGIAIFQGKELNVLKGAKVQEVLKTDIHTVRMNAQLSEILDLVAETGSNQFFVVDKDMRLQGYIALSDVRKILKDGEVLSAVVIAQDIMHSNTVAVTPSDNLDYVMKIFGEQGVDELPVVESRENLKVIGMVTQQEVIETYNRLIYKLDLADGMASAVSLAQQTKRINLSEDYALQEVEVPSQFIGHSIQELDIRKKYGVQVLLVKHHDDARGTETQNLMPSPKYVFQPNDRMLISGSIEHVEWFMRM